MSRLLACLCWCLALPAAGATLDLQFMAGLSVTVEGMDAPVTVNGVNTQMQRVVGVDVPTLARRICSAWQLTGDRTPPRIAGWHLCHRNAAGQTEVVQWRGQGTQAELLWSIAESQPDPGAWSGPDFSLPTGCAWVRRTSGSAAGSTFRQSTAACARSALVDAEALATCLKRAGWRTQSSGNRVVIAARASVVGQAIVMSRTEAALPFTTAIVWLETRRSGLSP
jgi:hypothetical protein